jgi:hypothetical protein
MRSVREKNRDGSKLLLNTLNNNNISLNINQKLSLRNIKIKIYTFTMNAVNILLAES